MCTPPPPHPHVTPAHPLVLLVPLPRRLLEKLNSGRGIVAVAIGSSYVLDFAGCWQTSYEALYGLGVLPNPYLYPQVRPKE